MTSPSTPSAWRWRVGARPGLAPSFGSWQYASGDYQKVLAEHGIVCSMSRRGNCWDNAVAERFFATLKVELVHDATWATRALARTALFNYLELFYNGQRRHSALGYLSPRAFERRRAHEALAT